MELNEYQKKAKETDLKTKINGDELLYPVLGLAGEAGEVSEKFKKFYRDTNGKLTEEYKESIQKELGDVLWYLAILSDKLGLTLEEVAQKNVEKLAKRKEGNKLHGSGDER